MSKLSELLFPYQIPGFCNRGFANPARVGSQGFVSWPEEQCGDALVETVCARTVSSMTGDGLKLGLVVLSLGVQLAWLCSISQEYGLGKARGSGLKVKSFD